MLPRAIGQWFAYSPKDEGRGVTLSNAELLYTSRHFSSKPHHKGSIEHLYRYWKIFPMTHSYDKGELQREVPSAP